MSLSRQQRDELWGDDQPYSQVELTTETRILGNHVSRIFLVAEVHVNPLTFKLVKQHRDLFVDDLEIQGILDHSEFQGQADGYVVCVFSEEFVGSESQVRAQDRVEITKIAIIRMHNFVMNELGLAAKATPARMTSLLVMTPRKIMDAYLRDQVNKISESQFKWREEAIGLFEGHGNNYAHLFADDEDSEGQELSDTDWCDGTDPEGLSYELFSHFVGYFLPRKVMSGDDGLRRLSRSIIDFYRWCCEREYIYDEHPKESAKALREEFTETLKSQ